MDVGDRTAVLKKEKGVVSPTLFGVIGHTKMDPFNRTLSGLVFKTTGGRVPEVERVGKEKKNTEYHILGAKSKTPLPGAHYGQVVYAGKFYGHVGPST